MQLSTVNASSRQGIRIVNSMVDARIIRCPVS